MGARFDDPRGVLHGTWGAHAGADDRRVAYAAKVNPVLPPVKQPHVFAEHLGHAVEELRTLDGRVSDGIAFDVRAIGAHAAGKYNLRHVEQPRRFQHVEGTHGVGVHGAGRVGLGGDRQGGAKVVNDLRPRRLDGLQYVAEISQVAPRHLHLVCHVAQPLRRRIAAHHQRTLLAP